MFLMTHSDCFSVEDTDSEPFIVDFLKFLTVTRLGPGLNSVSNNFRKKHISHGWKNPAKYPPKKEATNACL